MTDEKNADKPKPDPEIMAGWDGAIRKAFPERLVVKDDVHVWRPPKAKVIKLIARFRVLLKSVEVDYLSERDILDLQCNGLAQLKTSFNEFEKCAIDPLKEGKPEMAAHLYTQLWHLVGTAFIIGSKGTVSESTVKLINARATRKANSIKAEKAAIIEKIICDVMGSRIDKPYAVSENDRERINEELKISKLKPMTKKAIGDVRTKNKQLQNYVP